MKGMASRCFWIASLLVPLVAAEFLSAAQRRSRDDRAVQSEEATDYFDRWLKEDVVYIITPDERAIFESLTTEEEKEQFIEQFWFRRDPDPRTSTNEFKDEHYRRIAYVNERYFSAYPGWRTDRGRIYIIHGPPTEIESHPAGGSYHRPAHEGGGTTAAFPFEIWRYRHIEGLGSDIEIEFVDDSMTGEYSIARRAEEKDALIWLPGHGLTKEEEWGLTEKRDRPFFSPGLLDHSPGMMMQRPRDNPFERYATINFMQRPPQLRYNDLKELVEVNISFDNPLAVEVRQDHFLLSDSLVLAPVTVGVENKNLTFVNEGGMHRARVAIYGIVTSITNRIVTEFEHDLLVNLPEGSLETGIQGTSVYQKILSLERRMRYRLDLVVKDLNSGRIGVLRTAIVPPPLDGSELAASELVLSDFLRVLRDTPVDMEMFVIGDVWIPPSLSRSFPEAGELGVYLQVYNVELDQTTLAPELEVRYTVTREGQPFYERGDDRGLFVQYYSRQRVVLINTIPLDGLTPGEYRLRVTVRDRIQDREILREDSFRISAPLQRVAR